MFRGQVWGQVPPLSGHDPLPERLDAVEPCVRAWFEELQLRCQEEKEQYVAWQLVVPPSIHALARLNTDESDGCAKGFGRSPTQLPVAQGIATLDV